MENPNLEKITLEEAGKIIQQSFDALIVADAETNRYRSLLRRGFCEEFFEEEGDYQVLIEKLWFHAEFSEDQITPDYQVFIPTFSRFRGKYGKKLNIQFKGVKHVLQLTVYPINDNMFVFILDELDESEKLDEMLTEKVNTLQNTYLFSMYFDLDKDTTSSINITEISDDAMNTQIKYSEWRKMIVNMIGADDQQLFLERTDPEYLKKNFAPGKTSSFDCMMQNLEGNYIWVKLIFSRAETSNEDDYRFVFMVQNIHENVVDLMSTLKKYEYMALKDPLTGLNNHGRIQTEIENAIGNAKKNGQAVSLIMLDIDHFKDVNDEFGHAVGDITLKHFAAILSAASLNRNIVLGRWGGEEFVAVCYDMDEKAVDEFAEDLRKKVEKEDFEEVGHITSSLGITNVTSSDRFSAAFDRMDKAMYAAKSSGRNCVRRI